MNIVVDTNVILDDILNRAPNAEAAQKISQLATDALVVVCAEKAALDYIVTNDKGFLHEANLSVPAISPADFLLKFHMLP